MSLDGEPDFDKEMNRFQGICGNIKKKYNLIYRQQLVLQLLIVNCENETLFKTVNGKQKPQILTL